MKKPKEEPEYGDEYLKSVIKEVWSQGNWKHGNYFYNSMVNDIVKNVVDATSILGTKNEREAKRSV